MHPERRIRLMQAGLDIALSCVVLAVGLLRDRLRITPEAGRPVVGYLLDLPPTVLVSVHVLGAVLLLFRRRWPVAVALLLSALAVLCPVLAAMVMPYSVTRYLRDTRVSLGLSVLLLVALLTGGGLWDDFGGGPGDPYSPILGVTAFAAAGLYMRARSDLVTQLQARADADLREQRLLAERQRMADRTALAVALHDVAARWVTLMTMQAGAMSVGVDDSGARREAEEIRWKGEQALRELHRLIVVLSSDAADLQLEPEASAPTLTDLVRDCAPGLRVEVTEHGHPEPGRPEVAEVVRRVVAESLINATKHATGGSVTVDVRWTPDGAATTISSRPAAEGPTAVAGGGAGFGLSALAQRCAAAGGSLETVEEPGNVFTVRAHVPASSAS